MEDVPEKFARINQCLFGYDDGHRLLASSVPLTGNVTSSLLPLSDLVGGIPISEKRGYWTGLPLQHSGTTH
jgi:hypothetical protein